MLGPNFQVLGPNLQVLGPNLQVLGPNSNNLKSTRPMIKQMFFIEVHHGKVLIIA